MLAIQPGLPPQPQHNVDAPTLGDDRLCAGCMESVSSESGGVVVAFGQSLWHVDCFKCAKCATQVNADTNLLLLSDGSPVCANCYNCKICKLPILDEAVMTGDDSFHAECFKCRSCKERIIELVFAKTSQGFYCMKCHNERVARSRRHLAKKQRERERTAPSSSSGRPGTSGGEGHQPQPREVGPTGNGTPVELGSGRANEPMSHAATPGVVSNPSNSTNFVPRSASPIPPSVSVTSAGPTSTPDTRSEQPFIRPRTNSYRNRTINETSDPGTSSAAHPPPYSRNSGGVSDAESAQSTSSFGNNSSSTQPTSPSLSVSVSHEGSANEHHNAIDKSISTPTASQYRERSSSFAQQERNEPKFANAAWPGDMDQEERPRPNETGGPYLQPGTGGTAGLQISKRREKRNSVNPELQIEASKMIQGLAESSAPPSLPSPVSPTGSIPVSTTGTFGPQLSPTKPQSTSPLKETFGDNSSGSTAFYSASPSPQHVTDPLPTPRSAPLEPATSFASAIKKDAAGYFPQRSVSLAQGTDRVYPSNSTSTAAPFKAASGLPSSPYNGKVPTPLRVQRLTDEPSSRLSPRKNDFEDMGSRSRSASPAPPDVPRSIESGTDTETDNGNDSDDIMQSYMERNKFDSSINTPYPLPRTSAVNSPTDLRFSDSQPNSAGVDGDETYNQADYGASAVTTRQSGFFQTPALPPMRFSMNGNDFNDLLTNIGDARRQSFAALQDDKTLNMPEKSEDVASVATPTSIASTVTPLKELKPSTSSSSILAPSTFKPPERKASLRIKRVPPPALVPMPDDDEKYSSSNGPSLTTSPLSPRRNDAHIRRTSQPDATIRVFDELGSPRSPRSSGESMRKGLGHSRTDSATKKQDSAEIVIRRLREALLDTSERSADYVKLDRSFVEVIMSNLEQKKDQVSELSAKLDKMKRSSHMMLDGLTMAHDEYKQELTARRVAEEEISRLRIEVSTQAARITALSSDDRRREVQKQLAKEVSENLTGLEQDLSKLRVERDMTLAEVEELSASKTSAPNGEVPAANLGRSLTMRLDNIKRQYQRDLVPLTKQREGLMREILDLKEARDIFLEETAVLNARNEELAQLNTQYERKLEVNHGRDKSLPEIQPQQKSSLEALQAPPVSKEASGSSTGTLVDDVPEVRTRIPRPEAADNQGKRKPVGVFPWVKPKDIHASHADAGKIKKRLEHTFQQISVLRIAKCDLCGDKMWGSQARCSTCAMSVHVRCVGQVHSSCSNDPSRSDELLATVGPPKPSMFGRDLREQVNEDSTIAETVFIPIIVEKCINAVEANAMEYEGIYRKSGGSGQSKAITALFERREYDKFDLTDSDLFNDISSVTSVLKNYFRQLPNPLLTFGMHEAFVAAGGIKDMQVKGQQLSNLVRQLPAEHYHTLNRLMHHLCRIQQHADANLMNARNLGVIFGPTLMRSADPSREFADMAGKALAIEYLIENAPAVFPPLTS